MMRSIAAVALLAGLGGCGTAEECGSWLYSPASSTGSGGFFPALSSAFTFTPKTCGKSCDVQTDAQIQVVWVYDRDSGTFLYPTSSYMNRNSGGATVDRVDGEAYGWYSLINDGATFAPFWNTTGSNGTPTTLFDKPQWPGYTDISFSSIDAAVCFKSDTCKNRILGYYFWSWLVDGSGNVSEFLNTPAFDFDETTFQNAVAAWNAWAPTSGTESGTSGLPEPSLPNAVNLPSMSDL